MKISIRNICAWFMANVLTISGATRMAKQKVLSGEHLLSLYFHNPTKNEFEQCIIWLIKQKFKFISVLDLEKIASNEMEFPLGGVLITVDDGWQTNESNVVEVAVKYNVPVTIFISTQPVEDGVYWWSYIEHSGIDNWKEKIKKLKEVPNLERLTTIENIKKGYMLPREAMTTEQVKIISKSSVISLGSHTHSHPILTNCQEVDLWKEISLSKQKLESWINKEVVYFAYPNGNYSEREIEILKDLGYRVAFTNVPLYITRSKLDRPFEIPRIGILEGASLAENICRMMGVWHPTIAFMKALIISNFKSTKKPTAPCSKRIALSMQEH